MMVSAELCRAGRTRPMSVLSLLPPPLTPRSNSLKACRAASPGVEASLRCQKSHHKLLGDHADSLEGDTVHTSTPSASCGSPALPAGHFIQIQA